MPVKIICGRRPIIHLALLIAVVAGLLFAAGVVDGAFAQASPFGAPRAPAPAAPVGGVLGWIFAKQAEFYRQFSGLIRAAKADGSAIWSLVGLSFLYGIFHAAGPGHGKAVISSYIVANDETWTRGVILSFASALLQALVAVVVVGIAAVLLSASAATMGRAVNAIEIVSYSLIIVIGLRLLWVKGRAFLALLRTRVSNDAYAILGSRMIMRTTSTMPTATITSTTRMAERTIMRTGTKMHRHGGTRTRPSRRSSPAREDGSAGSPRLSPSACGRALERSWCWSSRWRRGCSGPESSPPSSWRWALL